MTTKLVPRWHGAAALADARAIVDAASDEEPLWISPPRTLRLARALLAAVEREKGLREALTDLVKFCESKKGFYDAPDHELAAMLMARAAIASGQQGDEERIRSNAARDGE